MFCFFNVCQCILEFGYLSLKEGVTGINLPTRIGLLNDINYQYLFRIFAVEIVLLLFQYVSLYMAHAY